MKKILIADDESLVLKLADIVLRKEGFEVMTACDGEEAVKRAKEFLPDLLLLDVRMPKIDGFEACKILRNDERFKTTPVIFVTADASISFEEKRKELQIASYLLKPYSRHDLLKKIQLILNP